MDKKIGKKVVVTGGAGFIGAHLVRKLVDDGYSILVFDNLSAGRKEALPKNAAVKLVIGDILDAKHLNDTIAKFKPDFLIHLAAMHFIPLCNQFPVKTVETNMIGTKHVLTAAAQADIKKVVIASSGAVYYGNSRQPYREDDDPSPADIYGYTKYMNEVQLADFYRKTGIPSVVARFFNVYGPGETNPHLIPTIFNQIREGKKTLTLGNMKTKRSYIYVQDIVRALCAFLAHDLKGYSVYNVGSDKEYSAEDVIHVIESMLGKHFMIKINKKLLRKQDVMHFLPDISRMQKDFSWKPEWALGRGIAEIFRK